MKNLGEVVSRMWGDQFLENLQKSGDIAVQKPIANYGVDASEIAKSLNIVPRAVMSWLVMSILPMKIGDILARPLDPMDPLAVMHCNKIDRDLYSGSITKEGKEITRFKNRTLPGVGMIIMSTLELYQPQDLERMPVQEPKEAAACQHAVLHELIAQDAAKAGMFSKLSFEEILKLRIQTEMELSRLRTEIQAMAPKEEKEPVGYKLRRFLENRDIQKRENTFQVVLAKGETCSCPDCGFTIYQDSKFSPCICFGDDRNRKIFLKKNEKGTQIKFAKGWDVGNIEMLLDILKRRNK